MTKKKTTEKKPCPITRTQFRDSAPGGATVMEKVAENIPLAKKEFSSGSFGYNGTGKIVLKIGDEMVKCQVTMNIAVVNSANVEEGGPAADSSEEVTADEEAA